MKQCYWDLACSTLQNIPDVPILILLWQHCRYQSPASPKLNFTICDSTRRNTWCYLMPRSHQSLNISSLCSAELSPVTAFPSRSVCVPFINMHNGRVHEVTYCYNFGFLHTNEVSSSILISVTLVQHKQQTRLNLPANNYPLIGSWKNLLCVQIISANFRKRYLSCNRFVRK